MKNRLFLTCVVAASVALLTGCDKVQSMLHLKSSKTVVAEATPAPSATPTPVPTPTPEPEPTPVAINRSAAVIILCYHRFEEKPADDLAISPKEFEEQLQTLKDSGISVIGMQDFLAWRRGEKDIPAKSAVITIDDGYLSGYSVAWPILKKFEYPFTMFVYVSYIGSGSKAMSWDQLAEMRDGGVDIQSHTYSHQSLRGRSPGLNRTAVQEIKTMGYEAWLKKEVAESKNVLERQLAIRVNALAYPYGMYNHEAREAIKAAGYEAAFTVYGQAVGFSHPESDLVGRYAVGSKNPGIFASAVKAVGSAPTDAGSSGPVVAQVAAASMATQPMEGETISDPKPVIKANLATMGKLEPGSIEMRISGFGPVPAKYDEQTKMLSFQPVNQPLRDKTYTVIISAKSGGKKVETRWTFNFDPTAAGAAATPQ